MGEYTSSGFFVLRAPLLSINEFLQLSSPLDARATARAGLRCWLERPLTREALWIASPDLLESLASWRDDPESAKGQKLERALYRYFARMTARATPFGAFASCTLGEVGGETHLELAAIDQCRRRTRLDMEYLFNLAEAVALNPALRRHVVFRTNDSLHLVAGEYHHLRQQWQEGARVYQLVATEPSPVVTTTLQRGAAGATAHALTSALLADDSDFTLAEAEELIGVLIESQLLSPALLPPVTGAEPVQHMISQLEQARLPGLAANLRAIAGDLRAMDADGVGADVHGYHERITRRVAQLPAGFLPGRLVQVDVTRPAAVATLDQRLVEEILHAITVLHAIRGSKSQPALERFKEEFALRYRDREVPLQEALDDEAGIGFESEDNPGAEPLLAGISFRPAQQNSSQESVVENSALACRVAQLAANRETVLQLDTPLLNELAVCQPLPLPDSFAALGSYFVQPDGQQGFCLDSVSGPSGANLLARFCDVDQRLTEGVQAHLRAEETLHLGDAVFAEVVHLPEGRVGNVVCRPVLREYEIPFLATPGVPSDRQIPLSDLTLSLRGDRMVLRSRRLGCEVIPRLTSAHDFSTQASLKTYKFLCLLQQQGVTPYLAWDWEGLQHSDFLPRVVLGNVVLAAACWTIKPQSAERLRHGPSDQSLRRVEEWRRVNNVPRFAKIAESDNQLLLDFENPLSVETFLEHIGKRSDVVLVEMFPAPDALPARGPEGAFVHEIVLPFVRRPSAVQAASSATVNASVATPRAENGSVPESCWLFAKLYCSPSHADRLLLELAQPLVEEALASGGADRWFFVRYSDPRWHLRLRFHGDPAALSARVLGPLRLLAGEQQRQGTLWRLGFDNYEAEVDRYGGPLGIQVAENLFQIDSELCLDLLNLTSGDEGAQLRWQLALCGVDRLLSALGLTLEEKETLAGEMARARQQDFVVDQSYKRQMAQKFRDHRQNLAELLQEAGAEPFFRDAPDGANRGLVPAAAIKAQSRFSSRLALVRGRFEDLRQAGELTKSVPELASSFVHMHLNRMFRSRHQEQECMVCEFLSRTYASALARLRIRK